MLFRYFFLFLLIVLCGTTKGQLTIYEDLPYIAPESGEIDTFQSLNLVCALQEENAPLLIWIGGGAWSHTNKDVELNIAKKLAASGINVATVGHRLSSEVWRTPDRTEGIKHPEHIKDIASATRWLMNNEEFCHYNKDNIFVGGFSSGAHLAMLIGSNPEYLEKVGLTTSIVKGIIGISGAYDIEDYNNAFLESENPHMSEVHVQAVFGHTREQFFSASPVNYIQNISAPLLIICDNALTRYTEHFVKKLQEHNFNNYELHYAQEFNHSEIWRSLSQDDSVYRRLMEKFINETI